MRFILAALCLAAAISAASTSAGAAELPNLDGQYCRDHNAELSARVYLQLGGKEADDAVAALTAGCDAAFERPIKAEAEKLAARKDIDNRMMNYCTADADYHGNGYLAVISCLKRELARKYERALWFGPYALETWSGSCSRNAPDGPLNMAEIDHCEVGEAWAKGWLTNTAIADATVATLQYCANRNRRRSYAEFSDCLADHRGTAR